MGLQVTDVRFVPARADDLRYGLLGFASFLLNGDVRLCGIAVRRTADGRPALSFPARRDRRGEKRPLVRPVSREVRETMEAQVFAALELPEADPWQ